LLLYRQDWHSILTSQGICGLQNVARYRVARIKITMMYTHKKSTAIRAPVFTKISNAQQRYLQISDTEFYTNLKINVMSADRNSLVPLRSSWLDPENDSTTSLGNVHNYCPNDTASHTRRVEH
jgi:hypothetical protein